MDADDNARCFPDGRLVFDGALIVRDATAICETLREMVARHAAVSIDCSAAVEVDLSFVQLLVASRASAALAGKTVSLAAHPDGPLLSALTRGGFHVTDDKSINPPAFWFDGAVE